MVKNSVSLKVKSLPFSEMMEFNFQIDLKPLFIQGVQTETKLAFAGRPCSHENVKVRSTV